MSVENKLGKSVNLNLIGLDGNAYSLMGAFSRQAKKENWSKDEIDTVLNECMLGDYDHLLCTLMLYCDSISDD